MRPLNPKPDAASGPWLRWVLNVGAVLGSVCLIFAIVMLVFGLKPLVFASGSMAPAIPTGSLALAVPMPSAEVLPGQVVSVVNSQGTRITHRAVSNSAAGGLLLKGDANPVADLQPYSADTVDRVVVSVPGLGFVVGWFSQPWLLFVAGLLCAGLLYVAFLRPGSGPRDGTGQDDGQEDGLRRRSGRRRGHGRRAQERRRWLEIGAMATAVALAVPLGAAVKVEPTMAAWAGAATAIAPMAAVTLAPMNGVSCANLAGNKNTIVFKWPSPATPPVDYLVTAVQTNAAGQVTAGGKTGSETIPGSSTSFTTSNSGPSGLLGSLLGLLLGYNLYFTITITARYGGTWVSVPVAFQGVNTTAPALIILGEYKVTCPPSPNG